MATWQAGVPFEFSAWAIRRREKRDERAWRKARDCGRAYGGAREDYHAHRDGTCGGYGSLCGACGEEENMELTAWAALQPDPLPGEDPEVYWRRIGGPFVDEWYAVSYRRIHPRKAVTA